MENQMLCYQCGGAKEGRCCNDTIGTCGKSAETSRLQDELTGALIGLAKASVHKSIDEDIQRLMVEGLAATAAHTDFDDEHILALTEQAKAAKTKFVPKFGSYNTSLKLPEDFDIRVIWQKSPDIRSLKSLLLFGIRGIALYAHESWALGSKNKEAAGFFHKALIALGANHFKEDYYTLLEEMGGISLRAMEQANKARFSAYGAPSPVSVPRVIDPGPFIIVSGHHFEILAQILEQTKETGVNVYSHGEMLPAHAYPEFRKYPHFKGHYGTGWQNQQQEFDHIPAAIVFTSGCIELPLPSYADRIFTAGNARIQGVPHLEQDFTPAIIAAIEQGGAPEQIAFPGVNGGTSVTTGFGRKTIRTVSYKLAAALAEGTLHHIYVVGGCDGNEANRGAYTDLIRRIPDDAIVFTWGCAKYRFNDIHYGEIDGVPRILDLGMCSDLPMVVETIEALAESAKLRVDELPLTWHYTWQGQRSTAEIFALFAADIQNIILGPAMPPYFTAEVFRALAKENSMTLFSGEASEKGVDAVPVSDSEPVEAETTEETPVKGEILKEEPLKEEAEEENASPYTPEELEERSEAAGLPDWAVMSEEEEAEAEAAAAEVRAEAAKAKPKIRPEDIDQSPAWLTADDDDEDETSENIPEEPKMDIEARSEAAGLPAWAMEDDEDEEDENDDGPAVEFIVKDGRAVPVFAEEKAESPAEPEPTPAPAPAEPLPTKADVILGETAISGGENAPKIVLPKGKGVSGWKDPDDEPSFTPGDRKPYRYTPPKELVEIPQPAPIALPAGAGISGYAADHSYDRDTGEETVSALYSFAEPQPEIKIPKGKGVSGWKEEDDTPRPAKHGGDSEKSGEKPWLKKSLERLHAEVEEANAPATPIPSATAQAQPKPPAAEAQPVTAEPVAPEQAAEATPATEAAEPAMETDPAKPWLAASLKQLKESIEADKEAEANKNSDKPWLQASLNALHAEVEAEQNGGETSAPETNTETTDENNDEVYVSKYKHDADAAAEKPWLKTSIEELKESIDRDAGIKSVRSEKKGPAKEKTDEEVAARWQNAGERKSWKDIVPHGEKAATDGAPGDNAPASSDNAVPAAPLAPEATDEPSGGGEPPEMWQKPKV
ncbi:MAG: hydroxylamine reductase, partial [Clostridia bacterium]